MFLVLAIAVIATSVLVIGAVLLISVDRAASLADHPGTDLTYRTADTTGAGVT